MAQETALEMRQAEQSVRGFKSHHLRQNRIVVGFGPVRARALTRASSGGSSSEWSEVDRLGDEDEACDHWELAVKSHHLRQVPKNPYWGFFIRVFLSRKELKHEY